MHGSTLRYVLVALILLAMAAVGSAATDLSVGWISRLPKIRYVWDSSAPAVEGWPVPGNQVRWVAHVRNLGTKQVTSGYRWLMDGKVIATGQATLKANGVTTIAFPWTWERKRHELVFEVDPANAIVETEERNNRLLIHTDALAVGFWVEQTFWSSIRDVVTRAGIGCTTFEDWMQRRIRQYNQMAELARYPETPKGVLDRWRIDDIHIVPDKALPVTPVGKEVRNWGADPSSYGTLYPNSKDRSIDMEWGFPAYTAPWFQDGTAWTLMYDSLVHELGHARYLIDVYAWDVSADNDAIQISPTPPATSFGTFHVTGEQGMMNTSWGFIDRYSAIALNRIAGHRATRGHYNEPANIGSFLNDLPEMNRVFLATPDGTVFPNRPVKIYQASGAHDPDWKSHVYQLKIDNQPDLQFTTDGEGAILVGRNPFAVGDLVLAVDRNNTVAVIELVDGKTSHWGYLEARQLNLEYWKGRRDFAAHTVVLDAPVCYGPGVGPDNVTPGHEALVKGTKVRFSWPATQRPQDFQLWYAVDKRKPVRVNVKAQTRANPISTTVEIHGKRVAWWLVYKNQYAPGECPAVRSSTFFFDLQN